MKKQKNFHGVVVPVTTPFTEDGRIDVPAAERIISRIGAKGLGVFVLGTTGETASIPRPERYKLVEAAIRASDGQFPVYAGIGDNCLANSVLAAEQYLELGVSAVVAHLPSYYPLTPEEMLNYFRILHDQVSGPQMVYNIPSTTRMSIPVSIVEQLAKLPRCVGFKDSENVPGRMEEVYQKLGQLEDFSLFMGSAVLSMEALKMGYDGLVPSSGNIVPGLWAELDEAAQAGNWTEARALQDQLNEVAGLFQKGRTLGQSLAALKAALYAINLCQPHVLPPLITFDEEACGSVRDQLLELCPFLLDEADAAQRIGG